MTPQNPNGPLQGMTPQGGMTGMSPGGAQPMQMGMPPPQMPEANPMMPLEDETTEQEKMEDVVNNALSSLNLAKKLKNKKLPDGTLLLEKMGTEIFEGYVVDEASRCDWREANKGWLALATLQKQDKTFPWPKASNVKYPLLSTAAMQFSARAYPALVPSDGKVVKTRFIPYDPQGIISEKAGRIAKHMSYQVMCKMPGWEDDMDRVLLIMAISGFCFKKTYHDYVAGNHRSDVVFAEDLVINYWAKSVESAYRKTELQYFTDNEIKEKVTNEEEFLDLDYRKADQEGEKLENATTGNKAGPTDKSTPHTFLACHTFWDMDGDGYEEPYIITVHKETKQVVRIIARWDLEGIHYNSKGKISRIQPVEYFTQFPFIPNPDGSIYAIGFGLLLSPLNESVNSLINQLIDAGTVNNLQSGFIGKGLRLKMGISTFQPGEWKVVNASGDDLNKQIVPLPAKEPSGVLMTLMQLLITSGNQLASIAEIMVGKMPGQNTPATTTQETVKQGMAVFTAIYKRVYHALESEFKKIFRLNSIVHGIVDQENKILGISLSASDYDDDSYIIPGGDPTGDSESTKLAKVQQVGAMLQLGTIDPNVYTKWALETAEIPNYQALIKQPPPPPPPDPMVEAKAKTEEAKAALLQQKGQLEAAKDDREAQKGVRDVQLAQMMAEIKAEGMKSKVANDATLQAMKLQGEEMKIQLDLMSKVLGQQAEARKTASDIQTVEVQNEQKIRHAEKQHQMKMKQKPKK